MRTIYLLIVSLSLYSYAYGQEPLQTVTDRGHYTTQNIAFGNGKGDGAGSGAYLQISDGLSTPQTRQQILQLGNNGDLVNYSFNGQQWLERFRITNLGNLGIGIANPTTPLSLGKLINKRIISLYDEPSDWYGLGIQGNEMRFQVGNTNAKHSFYAGDNRELMTIKGNGKVGIGTTEPVSQLHIMGGGAANFASQTLLELQSASDVNGNSVELKLSPIFNQTSKTAIAGMRDGINPGAGLSFITNNAERVKIDVLGNVGIGASFPDGAYKLSVNGKIRAKEIKVETNWSDFVFEPTYRNPSLAEVEAYIKANKHLPEIPSAKEVEANGINLGEMNAKLLQKIEELTLHLIEKEKELKSQEYENREQSQLIGKQEKRLQALEDIIKSIKK